MKHADSRSVSARVLTPRPRRQLWEPSGGRLDPLPSGVTPPRTTRPWRGASGVTEQGYCDVFERSALRPRPSLVAASVAALVTACTGPETTVRAPDAPQARSWVAAALAAPGSWSIGASSADGPLRLILPADSAELYLLGFPQEPVEVEAWLGNSCPPCELADPSWIFRRSLGEGPWIAAVGVPDELRRALVPDFADRCPPPGLCPQFHYGDVVLPVGEGCRAGAAICEPAVAVELDAQSALVAQMDGSSFRVGSDGSTEPLCDLRALRPLDGWRNAAGALWILGADLRLVRLEVSKLRASGACPIEAIIDPPEHSKVERLVVGEAGAAELYALTSSRALARYDGQAWQVLHRFPMPTDRTTGALIWIAPDRVAAVRGTGQVVEWQRGELRTYSPIPGTEVFLQAIARADNGRLALGIDGFGVYQADQPGGPWLALPNTHSFEAATRLLPWGQYWLLATANGVQVYHQTLGLCTGSFELTGTIDPGKLTQLSPDAVLVAQTQTYDHQGLVMRVLQSVPTDCSGR